jgi:hypothetical protein
MAWAQQSLPEGLRLSRMRYTYEGALNSMGLAEALAACLQFPTPGMSTHAVDCAIDRWASRDPAATAVAVTQMPRCPQRDHAFGILVRHWEEIDPAAAQTFLDQTSLTEEKRRYRHFNPSNAK